jgi:hypothetical protein
MHASAATESLINVALTDWERSGRAELDGVARDTTVGELVSEGVRLLGLRLQTFYQPLLGGRELNPAETIEEAGIQNGSELELIPEVSAG